MRRIELALWATTALLVAVATVAALWTPPVRVDPARTAELELPPPAPTTAGAGSGGRLADSVVATNLFAPSRTPPADRFTLFAAGGDAVPADPYAGDPAPDYGYDPAQEAPAPAPDRDRVPRLYGTVVRPGNSTALMRLDAYSPGARTYREGETGGRFRVLQINARSVLLEGPDGTVEIELSRPEEGVP